jgi:multiple sugar transport system substrate-binding protein
MSRWVFRFVSVFLSLLLFLTGCSSGQSTSTSKSDDKSSSGPQKTTINFAAIKTFGVETWPELIKKFEEQNPDIKVNLIQLPAPSESTTIHQYLVTSLQSGQNDIDVFTGDVIWVPEFAAAGWTEPLDSYITDKQNYYPGVIKALSYNGKLMAAPWYVDGGMLYYRKDLLDKYHQPVPKTWDELIKTAKLIQEKENNPKLQGFVWQAKQAEVLVCNFVEFLASAGGKIIDENGKSAINSSESVKALNLMKNLISDRVSPNSVLSYDEEPSRTVFTDGNAIFERNWSYVWSVAQNPEQSKVAGKVGVAPLPAFEGGKSASTMGGYQFMVSKNSKHIDAAAKFVKFLSNEENQLYFAKKLAFSPTRPDVLNNADLKASNPFLVSLNDVFQGTTARPVSPKYPQISLALQADVSAVLSGQMKPEDALKDLEIRINTINQ